MRFKEGTLLDFGLKSWRVSSPQIPLLCESGKDAESEEKGTFPLVFSTMEISSRTRTHVQPKGKSSGADGGELRSLCMEIPF